jgi:hypothetical protein
MPNDKVESFPSDKARCYQLMVYTTPIPYHKSLRLGYLTSKRPGKALGKGKAASNHHPPILHQATHVKDELRFDTDLYKSTLTTVPHVVSSITNKTLSDR